MVNIDTVYQRVLALANKEQRGYITPQEFNLFANQAQMEIFEQYFYDVNQFAKIPGNDYVYADVDDILEEKIQIFDTEALGADITNNWPPITPGINGVRTIPDNVYRIYRVEVADADAEILKTKDFRDIRNLQMFRSTETRPVCNIANSIIRTQGAGGQAPSRIHFIRIPQRVQWGYVVVNGQAMFDPNPEKTTHFELHRSDESELVYKILKFAGISMKRDNVAKQAQSLESTQVQQEKI
tara:strand:+ start:1068 stop:1787 length:720 start_codon:yes stop_codon:yes gene_type:complete